MAEDGIFEVVREVGGKTLGPRLARWLERAVEGTDDLPLARLLKGAGVDYLVEPAAKTPSLGVKLAAGNGESRLASVHDDGPAQAAGLSAGDVLIALDGLKVGGGKSLDDMLGRRSAGDDVEIHVFRRDELMVFKLTLAGPVVDKVSLKLSLKAGNAALKLRQGWLGVAKKR